jgi:hypothetical protein
MKDMAALTTFLKERIFDVYIDKQPSASSILESGFFGSSGAADKGIYRADILVQDACDIPLTKEMLTSYTAEWEEKTRTEKEREVELEHLRHTTTAQSSRIRLLEERAEASDKEHVQLASELVHAKVENEELRDLTEALNLQVSELKNVVDKQPAEVEEKLRQEMERIMQRNIEVQNENRAMEENMADMEKELVATKMKWAEVRINPTNVGNSTQHGTQLTDHSFTLFRSPKTTKLFVKNGVISAELLINLNRPPSSLHGPSLVYPDVHLLTLSSLLLGFPRPPCIFESVSLADRVSLRVIS